MIGVIVSGLAALVGLALVIGVLVDREARDAAWVRIATARRINSERATALEQQSVELELLEEQLASRERRLDFKEHRLFEWEDLLSTIEHAQRTAVKQPSAPPGPADARP